MSNSSGMDQMAGAALGTIDDSHEDALPIDASRQPTPTSSTNFTSTTQQSVHFGNSTTVASSPRLPMLGSRLQTPIDGDETVFNYPDDPEAEALLVPVWRRLEVLKRATVQSMPPPGVKAKSHMQVVRARLLPVGDFIVAKFSHLPDFGSLELRLCAVIAQKYWPLSRRFGTDLYIHSMYRNDQYLKVQKERRTAQETELDVRRRGQVAPEEQKMSLVLTHGAERNEERIDPFANNGLPRPLPRETSASSGVSAQENKLPDLIQAHPISSFSTSNFANGPILPQTPPVGERLNNELYSVQHLFAQGMTYTNQPPSDTPAWPYQLQSEHLHQNRERPNAVAPQHMMGTNDFDISIAEGFDAGELVEATRLSLLDVPGPDNVEGFGIDRALRDSPQIFGTRASSDTACGDLKGNPQPARASKESLGYRWTDSSLEARPPDGSIYDDAPIAEIHLDSETSLLPDRQKPQQKRQQSEQSVPDVGALHHERDVPEDTFALRQEAAQDGKRVISEDKSKCYLDMLLADDQHGNPDRGASPSLGYTTISGSDIEDGADSPPKRRRLNTGNHAALRGL